MSNIAIVNFQILNKLSKFVIFGLKHQFEMRKYLLYIFIFLLLGTAVWVYWSFIKVYSEGNRVGILSKFSKRGNIFKTYEGEIIRPGVRSQASGMSSQTFYFSVTDTAVANQLNRLSGHQVEVHYTQYLQALPWRGEKYESEQGQYIVDSIVSVREVDNINPYGL